VGLSNQYPLLDLFFTTLFFFAWVLYIWVAVVVILDIFRREMSGFAKVLWILFVIIFSWIGVLIYLLINHQGMQERRRHDVAAAQSDFNHAVREAVGSGGGGSGGSGGSASQLETAKRLLDSGAITAEEYGQLKAKVLAG
jgi:Short C-terminal domain/Phospholipase_D-nuclease N-terminal